VVALNHLGVIALRQGNTVYGRSWHGPLLSRVLYSDQIIYGACLLEPSAGG
jgi:hypothetical protein